MFGGRSVVSYWAADLAQTSPGVEVSSAAAVVDDVVVEMIVVGAIVELVPSTVVGAAAVADSLPVDIVDCGVVSVLDADVEGRDVVSSSPRVVEDDCEAVELSAVDPEVVSPSTRVTSFPVSVLPSPVVAVDL